MPTTDNLLADLSGFKETIKDRGLNALTSYWNTIGTIFGLLLGAISVVVTVHPETNKYLVGAIMLLSLLGIGFILACFHYMTASYKLMMNMITKMEAGQYKGLDEKSDKHNMKRIIDSQNQASMAAMVILVITCVLFVGTVLYS